MQSRWLYSPIFAKSRSELDIKANGKPDVNGTGPWKALCLIVSYNSCIVNTIAKAGHGFS